MKTTRVAVLRWGALKQKVYLAKARRRFGKPSGCHSEEEMGLDRKRGC
jgi:hypothetical protein